MLDLIPFVNILCVDSIHLAVGPVVFGNNYPLTKTYGMIYFNLTLFHTIPSFNGAEIVSFYKTL